MTGSAPAPGVRVEAAGDLDRDEVLDLYRAVGWTAYTGDPDVLPAALAGSTRVVVARAGDELVGLARVVSDGVTIVYLQDVLVRPDHQGGGVGSALVRAALAPYAGVRQKVLLTDDDPKVMAFYRRLGYHQIGERPVQALRAFIRLDD